MFSFNDYKEIIRFIKATGAAADYWKALKQDKFIITRHDIEYSVDRAHALSRVEESLDFTSSYFFQWTNNSYNILSRKNGDMIKDMHERGHRIGLHFALNGLTEMEAIKKQISKEINILSEMFGFEIDRFSIHRPSQDVLRANIKLPGIINAYQEEFFTFRESVTAADDLPVKYFSDANHIWRYGYPDQESMAGHNKIQILIHPFAWTRAGHDNFNNYKTLIREKYAEMVSSIDNECKDFGEYRDYFREKAETGE